MAKFSTRREVYLFNGYLEEYKWNMPHQKNLIYELLLFDPV